ncbi:MAG: helix-turn-helix transcriptional regulator [Clostridia bacterium]|nr:helix-turn-helix transcriptional regulator [Clostridia bacterium]MBR3680992.1 helix-turn-helix transcriptional regulator [Clostridia bacterium]
MFKNKNAGRNNLCGERVRELRLSYPTKMSQRALADKLQLLGIDVDKNAIQRIESGKRFVTDIELKALATVFAVSLDELI